MSDYLTSEWRKIIEKEAFVATHLWNTKTTQGSMRLFEAQQCWYKCTTFF
jgi:hypothetical protein